MKARITKYRGGYILWIPFLGLLRPCMYRDYGAKSWAVKKFKTIEKAEWVKNNLGL